MCKQPILPCHRRMLSHKDQIPDNAPLVPTDKQRKNLNYRPILKNKRLAVYGGRPFFKNHPPILKNGTTSCKRKLKAICISPADVLSL